MLNSGKVQWSYINGTSLHVILLIGGSILLFRTLICSCSFRIANGLDRSWEARRVEGMEMLQHSVEILKERQGRRQPSLPERTTHAVTRHRSKSRPDANRCHNQTTEPSFNLPVHPGL